MSQLPSNPPRRTVKVFRRQNSFAGFPSAALTIFNNNLNNVPTNNNNARNSSHPMSPPTTSAGGGPPPGSAPPTITSGVPFAGTPTTSMAGVTQAPLLSVYQPTPAANRPPTGFYSLPRHNRPGQLSRALGVGSYLLQRTTPSGSSGPTAAQQLGINAPSLPKAHRRNLSDGNTSATMAALPLVLAPPPSRSKSSTREASGSGSSSGGEPKLKSSSGKRSSRDSEGKQRRRDPDHQSLPRRPGRDQSKRSPKDADARGQSASKRHEPEPKFRSLPRRHDTELSRQQGMTKRSDVDPKYQSLPRKHSTEPRYQTLSKRRDMDLASSHHPPSPKRRGTEGSSSSPKRREAIPGIPGGLPSSPKRRDTGNSHQPGSPKRDPSVASPKRRSSEPKYQPLPPRKYDLDPKYEMLPPKRTEVDIKYQTVPQKRHDPESRRNQDPPAPRHQEMEPRYHQAPTPKRYDYDPRYHPLPPPSYEAEPSRYQTIPPKRRDMDFGYPPLPPKKFGIEVKYQPLPPPPQYDPGPRYQTIPPKRHDHDHRHHYVTPPRPDIEPKPTGMRSDFDPHYQHLPQRAPDIEPKYQQLPHRSDIEPKYQQLPPRVSEYDHRYQQYPLRRPDIEPKYQQLPPRMPEMEPRYQQLPPRPDIEPQYQQLPPRRPDIEPRYGLHTHGRPDIEPRYQPPQARPDIEPNYQPLPPRPDIEPRHPQLPPRRPDIEPNYQSLPPRPDIEPRYSQMQARRPDIEPKYQQLPPRRPDIEPKYPGLTARPDIEPKFQPMSSRPDIEPTYQPLPPRGLDLEPKYQQLPPRRPDIEPNYQQLPLRGPDLEPKYQQLPPRRPDIEPKYQQIPPKRPDIEPKTQQMPHRGPEAGARRPDVESRYQPPMFDYEFKPIPTIKPNYDRPYATLPSRHPDGDAHPLPPTSVNGQSSLRMQPTISHPIPVTHYPSNTLPLSSHPLQNTYSASTHPIPTTYSMSSHPPITHPHSAHPPHSSHPMSTHPPHTSHHMSSHPVSSHHMSSHPPVTSHHMSSHPPPTSHPMSTHPPHTSHPMSTYASTSHPMSTHPPTSHPMSTHPPNSHSISTHPPTSHPMSTHPPSSHPMSTHPPTSHSMSTHPPNSHPMSTHPPNSHPMSTHPPPTTFPISSHPPPTTYSMSSHPPPTTYSTSTYPPPTSHTCTSHQPSSNLMSAPLSSSHQPSSSLPPTSTHPLSVSVPRTNAPLYESIITRAPATEPVPAKIPGVIPLYEGIPPRITLPDPLHPAAPNKGKDVEPLYQSLASPASPLQADEAEPLYQASPPRTTASEPLFRPGIGLMSSGEPLYQSSPDAAEGDPVYQAVTPQMIQDVKCNYQLLQQRKMEQEAKGIMAPKRPPRGDKYHSPTKRTFRERDAEIKAQQAAAKKAIKAEPKYQTLPKKKEKEADAKPPSHPRRVVRQEPLAPLAPLPPRWTSGDDDGLYSSLEYPSEGGRSEDEIYSSLNTTTTEDPVYQSVSEASYSRPVPPLPAPLRYRRRADDAPPPLPPPRLTTGPVGPHNPLVSPVPPSVLPARTPHGSDPGPRLASYPVGSSNSPSPDNLLGQGTPTWPQQTRPPRQDTDEIYSSIPSLPSSTPESPPATLPRASHTGRVAPSASWNSLGSSGRSSWDSLGSSGRSECSTARQRRRRARSDPRMDAGVLHRLAFTIWHTALHIEKENNNDVVVTQKQPGLSSRNTQSAARLNRVMVGGGGVEGGGGGAVATGGPRMDVVYVTERIISLAFPPGLDDATYTLHLREVAHMLSSKHGDNFKVFNLSGAGEVSQYLPRVLELGWAEQLAPALERLCSVCKALDSWITQHPQHVAVLHARGGYEKLGVVVAAYMHYSNICAATDQALDRYAMKRFFDDKIGQLYHPSQKRYVQYFAGLLSGVIRINSSPLYLHTLTLYGVPHFEPRGGCHLFIKIYQGMTPIYTSGIYNLTETMRQVTIGFESGVQLRGDILLKAYHRRLLPAAREVIFRVQFHTCAVSEKILAFTRTDLDDACNDMRFPLDGNVELYFSHSPEERPRILSSVSCDKSPCAIASWDSYQNINFTDHPDEQGVGVSGVSHTLGPLDGSLYATVTKKRHHPPLSASPHSPQSPHAPGPAHTPSPHGLLNGRYAASIDSGIASSNSAGAAPVSPPTSDTSQTSGESRGTAAAVAPGRAGSGVAGVGAPAAPPLVDARQLDELLQGMLLDIQSIPDLRPSLTHAPDIDSIRCPDFTTPCPPPPRDLRRGGGDGAPLHSPVNGYSGSTTQDSLLDTSMSTTDGHEVPYHARTDSKPFSYGAVTSSPLLGRRRTSSEGGEGGAPPSPSVHRRDSREALHHHRAGLESPRLVRRMSGSVGGTPGDAPTRRSPSPSPSPEPGSRSGSLHRQRSQTLTTRLMSTGDTPTSTLTRSHHAKSASTLDHAFDSSFDSHSRSFSSTGSNNLSWLQMQQRKLAERREAKFRAERGPQEARMLSELRTRMTQHRPVSNKDFEDGYVSDTTLLSETSRESSPVKTLAPLTINTGAPSHSSPQKPPIGQGATPARGSSAPSSPVPPNRNNVFMSGQRSLPRKHSDTSDRERPFVAVKRAHDTARTIDTVDSSAALSQLQTSPHGHINYSSYASSSVADGLLTTVASSSQERQDSLDALTATLASLGNPPHHPPTTTTLSTTTTTSSPPHPSTTTTITTTTAGNSASAASQSVQSAQMPQSREESSWQSDNEGSLTSGNRPITPGFPPATPTTPYLNQGLPPKSPTMQRREFGGVRSPSPATSSQFGRQEVNGHSSPAPSLYHGQSRRSSLTSLTEAAEVISSHPKFVKDISKFWYKPTITRDEAISMLREKSPGTFVVRDSNSFPGAFGLALKVSTPPPNVANKSSSDPASELVRHFLIEPTSRGVRLKGCPNEPVFGSLSALVYQHSITPLALPCRLVLPERDPVGMDPPEAASNTGNTTQLLQQGAACNVMYLHTTDTESLTGPQAVKRAVSLTLATRTTPTVVHFKVSAQGITLTDNERKLFFRRHYPVNTISHCGLDPDDRRWTHKAEDGSPLGSLRIFGFVAKKGSSRTENQCHILAELEPEQPATAICNFVTKVMMTSVNRPNLV